MSLATPALAVAASVASRKAAQQARPKAATAAQRAAVGTWATTNLAAHPRPELLKGLAMLQAHPDAYSAGYSPAKSARERLEKHLA